MVEQVPAQSDRPWRELPAGTWFAMPCNGPLHDQIVAERTPEGFRIVCAMMRGDVQARGEAQLIAALYESYRASGESR